VLVLGLLRSLSSVKLLDNTSCFSEVDTGVNGKLSLSFPSSLLRSFSSLLTSNSYRLNKIYRESVSEQEILDILKPMIKSFALERNDGEHFGDFVIRKGIIAPTTSGKAFCKLAFFLSFLLLSSSLTVLFETDENMTPGVEASA